MLVRNTSGGGFIDSYRQTGVTAVSGNPLLRMRGYGYDSSTYQDGAELRITARGTWTGSSLPTALEVFTTDTGSTTPTLNFSIEEDGTADFQSNDITGVADITATGTVTGGQVDIKDTAGVADLKGVRDTGVAVASGNSLFSVTGQGYDGSSNVDGASIKFKGTETWNGSSRGSSFSFFTVPNGTTTQTKQLEIGQDGTADFQGNNICLLYTSDAADE